MASYRQLKKAWGYCCAYCGRQQLRNLTVDHVIALANGGPNHWTNLVPACSICNVTKGRMSLDDFEIALSNPWRQSFTARQIKLLRSVYTEGSFRGFHMQTINREKLKPFEVKSRRPKPVYKRTENQERLYAERECRRLARVAQ